jgi:GGDEF domain-containing protein
VLDSNTQTQHLPSDDQSCQTGRYRLDHLCRSAELDGAPANLPGPAEENLVGRIGDEEFAVSVPGPHLREPRAMAERLWGTVALRLSPTSVRPIQMTCN